MHNSFLNESFIVGSSFIFFLSVFIIFFGNKITSMLDNRRNEIKSELDEAEKLYKQAKSLHDDYKIRQEQINNEAQQIIETAKREASIMIKNAQHDIEEQLVKKSEEMKKKMNLVEASLLQEMHSNSVDIAVTAVKSILSENLTSEAAEIIVKKAISDIQKKLH